MSIHTVKLNDIQEYDAMLPAYAWPGGYRIVYVDGNNEILCADCATKALTDPDEYDEWRPYFSFIHYEGPSQYCSECNREMESAYGDPSYSQGQR